MVVGLNTHLNSGQQIAQETEKFGSQENESKQMSVFKWSQSQEKIW